MDSEVWRFYLRELLRMEISEPSVVLVDNLDCHVSTESKEIVALELNSILQPLPKNATSVCQPLDVGVMGPLKAKLRAEWLLSDQESDLSAREKRHATILRTIRAWDSILTQCVKSAFNKALGVSF